jgi:alpha-L-rhamnosidase
MAGFAEILDRTEDADTYYDLAEDIKEAFIRKYLIPNTGKFDTLTTQITQVFALWYELVPEGEKEMAFDVLINEILQKHNGHLSTGIFGTKMLFDVLRKHNRNDVAYKVVSQRDYPGYGYMLENGATTLWEHWHLPEQNSLNHPMFGSVSEWFYRSLLGINPRYDACGFDKIYIKPYIVGNLSSANGVYRSVRGDVKSGWDINSGLLNMDFLIAPNIDAIIYIPTTEESSVTVNGVPASEVNGFDKLGYENGYAIYHTGNGELKIQAEYR